MTIRFSKYQGTGNDFILVDNRVDPITFTNAQVTLLCDRKFGIGSDGLILLDNTQTFDFEMRFYNPDGSTSFCGNGSRCVVHFAHELGIIDRIATFNASDGMHSAEIEDQIVKVKMADCSKPEVIENGSFINTGSPHFIVSVQDIQKMDIIESGKPYRQRTDLFGDGGTNVNFIQEINKGELFVRTFERGVEAETLSCGTGVTASAIVYGLENDTYNVKVETPGGTLKVDFKKEGKDRINDIFLSGSVEKVFDGVISI